MADEVDIAGDYIERTIEKGIEDAIKEADNAKKRLIDLKENNIPLRCKWCDDEIEGYDKSFCSKDCGEDYKKYAHQRRVEGLPVD